MVECFHPGSESSLEHLCFHCTLVIAITWCARIGVPISRFSGSLGTLRRPFMRSTRDLRPMTWELRGSAEIEMKSWV